MIELALNTEDYGLKQVNHESGRWYEDPETNRYYSITNVLSILSEESIQKWRARVGEEEANRISRQASGKGTEVHDMIEAFVLGEIKETKNLLALQNFKEIKPIIEDKLSKVYATEKRMFSSHLGVAGTVDCVGEWEGKTSIIDWKTSKKFKKKEWIHSYFMQAAAYAIMWEERTGRPIKQLVICIAGDQGPQIFIEDRDNWTSKLIDTINEYKRRKLFGR